MIKPFSIGLVCFLQLSTAAHANSPADITSSEFSDDEIVVHGRSLDLIGSAKAASEAPFMRLLPFLPWN